MKASLDSLTALLKTIWNEFPYLGSEAGHIFCKFLYDGGPTAEETQAAMLALIESF